jgi:hypothetical protein
VRRGSGADPGALADRDPAALSCGPRRGGGRLPGTGEPWGGGSECAAENGVPEKRFGPSRKMLRAALNDDFLRDALSGKGK